MSKKIFIDGESGTTGLEITKRLHRSSLISKIELLTIPAEQKKSLSIKRRVYQQSDLVVLCLPDEAAKNSVKLLLEINQEKENPLKCLDASTAHRTTEGWVYGFPQIKTQKEKIKSAILVSNPGCYATGFIVLVRPLVENNLLPANFPIHVYGFSGYSGGGKALINYYEENYFVDAKRNKNSSSLSFAPYDLDLTHKHLPEMQKHALLDHTPLFQPAVTSLYEGMLVNVPLHSELLKSLPGKFSKSLIKECYLKYYRDTNKINILELSAENLLDNKFLDITKNNVQDNIDIIIAGQEHLSLWARLNNLGKGSAGSAIENIGLMLNIA